MTERHGTSSAPAGDPTGGISIMEQRFEDRLAGKADRDTTNIQIEHARGLAEEAKTIALAAKSRADRAHECVRVEAFDLLRGDVQGVKTEVAGMKGAISSTNIKIVDSKTDISKSVNWALRSIVAFLVTGGALIAVGWGSMTARVATHDENIAEIKASVNAIRVESRDMEKERRLREDQNWTAMRGDLTRLVSDVRDAASRDQMGRQAARTAQAPR
jgi:hypothetical protein